MKTKTEIEAKIAALENPESDMYTQKERADFMEALCWVLQETEA